MYCCRNCMIHRRPPTDPTIVQSMLISWCGEKHCPPRPSLLGSPWSTIRLQSTVGNKHIISIDSLIRCSSDPMMGSAQHRVLKCCLSTRSGPPPRRCCSDFLLRLRRDRHHGMTSPAAGGGRHSVSGLSGWWHRLSRLIVRWV